MRNEAGRKAGLLGWVMMLPVAAMSAKPWPASGADASAAGIGMPMLVRKLLK